MEDVYVHNSWIFETVTRDHDDQKIMYRQFAKMCAEYNGQAIPTACILGIWLELK